MTSLGQSQIGWRWPTIRSMGDGCWPWRRSARNAWLLAAVLVCGAAGGAAQADDACQPWPGEPALLPRPEKVSPSQARWMELRVSELVARAQAAEARDPVESHRLWRRVLCFDAANELAWRGVDRTRLVRVYRPMTGWGRTRAAAVADPWVGLATTISVPVPAPPAPLAAREPPGVSEPARAQETRAAAELERERLDRARSEAASAAAGAESSLREARFEEALARAKVARSLLENLPTDETSSRLRTRIAVLSATAEVALGDEDAARESFTRALASNPGLRLDPMKTSPKVMQALSAARAGRGL